MKDTWSIFDVIGPIMVGPSSSHTAGACKLGYMARIIFGKKPKRAVLKLHGSFGEVYEGHCTDVAVIGGLLGMLPSNPDIKKSYEFAEQEGMEIQLVPTNLGPQFHPNTVQFILSDDEHTQTITGSSLGGGKIKVTEIDKIEVSITGSYSSLLVCYENSEFQLNELVTLAANRDVSIVKMETTQYKERSLIDIEIKEFFGTEIIHEIEKLPGVLWARFVNHISHYDE